jgi:hypothetical protein
MIRTAKVIFCDNEHGTGDVMFPEYPGEHEVQQLFIEPKTVAQQRKEAKEAGWRRHEGGDYCPGCVEGGL